MSGTLSSRVHQFPKRNEPVVLSFVVIRLPFLNSEAALKKLLGQSGQQRRALRHDGFIQHHSG